MKTYTFTVKMEPVAKARARTVRNKKTGDIFSYTPKATKEAEAIIHFEALKVFKQPIPREKAVEIEVAFCLVRPKSSKRTYVTVKPDLDNYLKLVMDALNGVAWEDDAQVMHIYATKMYSEPPEIDIEIRELD